jgi:hypothetical protein
VDGNLVQEGQKFCRTFFDIQFSKVYTLAQAMPKFSGPLQELMGVVPNPQPQS